MSKIVFEWDRSQILAAQGEKSGRQVTLTAAHLISRSDEPGNEQTITDSIRKLFPSTGKNPLSAVLILPRQQVTIHRVQLPQVPDHEMPDIVRLQASMKLTVPVETVLLDFAPLPVTAGSTTREVLLVSTPQDQFNSIRRILASCQIQLAEVRVSSFCLAKAAEAADILKAQSDPLVVDALVLMREDLIEVTFVRGTSVIFAHSGASWSSADGIEKAVRSELSRARMAASESLGEYRIGRLLLLGRPEVTGAVSEQIVSRMDNATIERVDLSKLFTSSSSKTGGVSPEMLLGIAGVIGDDSSSPVTSVDLLNPRKAPERRDLRRVKVLGGVLAALLLVAVLWNSRQRELRQIQEEQDALDAEISELRDALKRGEPDLALAGMVSEWAKRDINWLDEMTRLKALLPGSDRMLIKNVQVGSKAANGIGTVRIDGTAKNREDVELLGRKLTEAGYLVMPYNPGDARVSGPYPVGITLQLTIPDRTPPQAGRKS